MLNVNIFWLNFLRHERLKAAEEISVIMPSEEFPEKSIKNDSKIRSQTQIKFYYNFRTHNFSRIYGFTNATEHPTNINGKMTFGFY